MKEGFEEFMLQHFDQITLDFVNGSPAIMSDLTACYRHAYYQGVIDAIKRASEIEE